MTSPRPELSRREFLTAATATAALLALNLNSNSAITDADQVPKMGRRLGISDEAYAAAQSRAQALAAQMTLQELISQVGDKSAAIPRLNIAEYNYYSNEALHGLCTGPQVTSFPVPLALAAAWNPDLAHQVYTAVADECRAHDHAEHAGLSFYSPATLNLHRDPRWGRCYEAPGEDPCLAATVAVQIVRGMQGDHPEFLKTTACSKHFICNNTDDDRESVSATVDPRSFWEFYTRAYRATILYGDVFTFMSAYSAINGIPCSADHALLTDLLRGQWAFRGYVSSDCDAVKDIYDPHHYAPDYPNAAAMGINAGCDLNCWGGTYQTYLEASVNQKLVTQQAIAQAVSRLLTVRILLGTLDPTEKMPYSSITLDTIPWKAHQQLALESARQSLVLLKNQNDFLPFDPKKINSIAVIGPLADTCHLGGYSGSPARQISPLKGIADKLSLPFYRGYIGGGDFTASHGSVTTQGSPNGTTQLAYIKNDDWARFDSVDFTGKTELRANVECSGTGGTMEIHLDKPDGPLAATYTVADTGGWDHLKELAEPLSGVTGVHDVYTVFHGGDGYIMNLERLTLYPLASPTSQAAGRQITYSSGCTVSGERDDAAFQQAVDSAKNAEVVVLVCGVDTGVDGEGHDRDTIGLTGAQPDLIRAVQAVNPNVVLVLSSNNSVSIEWEQTNLPAILCAVCAGQEQGGAIADVLFGDYNPGGKLPCTWYRSVDQLPPSHDYDIHNGRTYQYFEGDPLYPFGYGLSYTTFQFDQLTLRNHTIGMGGTAKVSAQVTNTGERSGAEVVQLYIVPPASPVKRPRRQLAGFQRVHLEPGEQKTVLFEVPYTAQPFWYWSEPQNQFVCQPGIATLEIGNSSARATLIAPLTIQPPTAPLPQPDAVDTVAVNSTVI